MSGSWLLVEDGEQAAAAHETGSRLSGCRYLASSPAALAGLRQRDLEAVCLFRFLSLDELNQIARRNEKIAEAVCAALDRGLEAAGPDLPAGFRPFDALTFQLKCLLHALCFRQRELDAFLESEAPEALYFWPPASKGFDRLHEQMATYSQPFSYGWSESAAGDLLSVWGGTSVRAVPEHGAARWASGRPPAEPRAFGRLETLLRAALNFNRLSGLRALGGGNLGRETAVALRLTALSDSEEVLAFLRSAVADPTVGIDWWTALDRPPVSMRTGRAVRLGRSPGGAGWPAPSPERLRGIVSSALAAAAPSLPRPVTAVLGERVTRYARRRIPQLSELFVRAQRYIELRQPAALLTGTTTGDAVQTVGHACRLAGVRLVAFQHGGNFGYVRLPQLASSDLKVADLFCAYGDGVRRGLERQRPGDAEPTKVLNLGWARQGRAYLSRQRQDAAARRARPPGATAATRPQIMYVATNLMGDRRLGPAYWYDDTAYFLQQIELIDTLAQNKGVDLTVKLHYKESGGNPLVDHLRQSGPDGVRILRRRPFPELLRDTDVIVMDWPATTLLEALARDKQVIYVDLGWLTWEEEARELLREEARWIARGPGWRRELQQALEESLAKPPTGPRGRFSAAYASADYRPQLLLDELRRPSDHAA